MKSLNLILTITQNPETVIELANACYKAYADGTGNPDWYSPFGAENPELVAQNLAAIAAFNTGLSIFALNIKHCEVPEEVKPDFDEMVFSTINGICDDTIGEYEKEVLLRLANCAWNAGQSFRDISTKPLVRVKNMNMFDSLPYKEVVKDWHQIKAVALFLKKKLGC